jgi:hypothetical protein
MLLNSTKKKKEKLLTEAYSAEAVSSSVDRCIETYGLLVFLVLVLVVFVKLFVLAVAGTIIHLVDCLYDVFMESEESSSTAEATTIEESSSTAVSAAATAEAEATSATAEATSAEAEAASPCQCSLFWYCIYHC